MASSGLRFGKDVKLSPLNLCEIESRIFQAQDIEMDWTLCVPEPIADIMIANGENVPCNGELIFGPFMTAAASLMHYGTRIQLKPSWSEPPIIWLQVASKKGTKRSVAVDRISCAVKNIEMEMNNIEPNSSDKQQDPLIKRRSSSFVEFLVEDLTYERLHHLLVKNKSLLYLYHECQFFYEMVEINNRMHRQIICQLFDGGWWKRNVTSKTTIANDTHLNFGGSILPSVLMLAINTPSEFEGIFDRILIFCPKEVYRSWSDQKNYTIDSNMPSLHTILRTVWQQHLQPVVYTLSAEADEAFGKFIDFRNANIMDIEERVSESYPISDSGPGSDKTESSANYFLFLSNLRGIYSKSEGHVARLAMVMQATVNALYACWSQKFQYGNRFWGKGYESVNVEVPGSGDERKPVIITGAVMHCAINLMKHFIKIKKCFIDAHNIMPYDVEPVRENQLPHVQPLPIGDLEQEPEETVASNTASTSAIEYISGRTAAAGITMEQCYEQWGDLLTEKRRKIVTFMTKMGSGYNFRFIAKSKIIPPVQNKCTYVAVEAFLLKLVEFGFGDIDTQGSTKSKWIFKKKRFEEMCKKARNIFILLGIDRNQYENTFKFGLVLY